ncbi:hypothetical protein COV28_00915 [candidate division WWE3 bacterium CG10_big_fil_rev_8_21_14_0_10_48_23]|uniref:Uncharacterized protein n=1 Tax=candidate division WWE3 bacterium CG_4_9_14_0_2_um_filter_48_10 TaxID=1975078 RepID=A0A2M8EJN9_UNCKA|nr:MAG: hypothetical protein CO059_01070 [candidate division WWE3 bacterium CG_4_9_14_0_2_um_filter_48_10]PJE52174.1 MAG: hypothetical protein COV28_00915 [candidate division WWE3 bacterium CG10_big_fil_rev_8_21_14_0_10_48_23]
MRELLAGERWLSKTESGLFSSCARKCHRKVAFLFEQERTRLRAERAPYPLPVQKNPRQKRGFFYLSN